MGIGEHLGLAIDHAGMSRAEVARRVGVSPSRLGNYLNDARKLPISLAIDIATALNLSLDALVGRAVHDGKGRYSGKLDYSGDPQPLPLSPALRQALRLDEDATEVDALERIASLPHSAHRTMEMLQEEARRRQILAAKLAAAQQLLAEALEELAAAAPPGFSETPPPAFRDAPAHHAGFAEPAPPAFQPFGRPDPSPDDEKD